MCLAELSLRGPVGATVWEQFDRGVSPDRNDDLEVLTHYSEKVWKMESLLFLSIPRTKTIIKGFWVLSGYKRQQVTP